MNRMMARALLLAVAFIVSVPFGLMAQDEGFYPYSFARLSYVNGVVSIQRTADLGYETGEVNLALVQGDRIATENGQAEIHFGRRNYLRLGDNTKVEFAALPTEGEELIKIYLTEGRAYFRVSQLALDKGIEVHTPDASLYILEEGLYRFDVRAGGETQVFALEGSLEAAAEEGSVLVRAQETVTAADGRFLDEPGYGDPTGDALDSWNGSRDAQLSTRSERQYLPSDLEEYEEELDQNGSWIYERPYGNVWVPHVSPYDDWRPYCYGRWVWYPVIGWTWVPSESWGWPVYHYGRWNWRFGLGWYWIPQHYWGPAWVHWWWDSDYVGWCPLTWYNRPGYLFHDRFYDRHDDRFFSAHNRAMTVVRRDHLQSPDIYRRQVGVGDLDRIGRVELGARQPMIRPAVDNVRPEALAARRVLGDRPGSPDQVKPLASSRSISSLRPRSGDIGSEIRPADRSASPQDENRNALARPSIRGSETAGRTVRSYPSGRSSADRGQGGAVEDRRSGSVGPGRRSETGSGDDPVRVYRSRGESSGTGGAATGRETQRSRMSGNGSGSSVVRPGGSVRSYPSTPRPASSSPPAPRSSYSSPSRSSGSSSGHSSSAPRPSSPPSSGRANSPDRSGSSSSKSSGSSSGSGGAVKK